jgi:hypothetical protein
MRQSCTRILQTLSTAALISCGTTEPLPITRLPEGNVKRLMEMEEFSEVKDSTDGIKRWAKEALHVINDLEYTIRTSDGNQ